MSLEKWTELPESGDFKWPHEKFCIHLCYILKPTLLTFSANSSADALWCLCRIPSGVTWIMCDTLHMLHTCMFLFQCTRQTACGHSLLWSTMSDQEPKRYLWISRKKVQLLLFTYSTVWGNHEALMHDSDCNFPINRKYLNPINHWAQQTPAHSPLTLKIKFKI